MGGSHWPWAGVSLLEFCAWTLHLSAWSVLKMLVGYTELTYCTVPIKVLPLCVMSWLVGFCTLTLFFGVIPAFSDMRVSKKLLWVLMRFKKTLEGGAHTRHSTSTELCLGMLILLFVVCTTCALHPILTALIKGFALFFLQWGNYIFSAFMSFSFVSMLFFVL